MITFYMGGFEVPLFKLHYALYLQVCVVGKLARWHGCCQLPIWRFCQASASRFLQPVSGRCSVSLLGPGVLAEPSRDEDRQAQLPRGLLRNLRRWHYQWGTLVWCARWVKNFRFFFFSFSGIVQVKGQNFIVLKGITATAFNESSSLECLHRVQQVSVFDLSLSWQSRMFVRSSWRFESLRTIYLMGSRCRTLPLPWRDSCCFYSSALYLTDAQQSNLSGVKTCQIMHLWSSINNNHYILG